MSRNLAVGIGLLVLIASGLAVGSSLVRSDTAQRVTPQAPAWTGARVRVEVLNVGGVTGRAREATERLRRSGFDVVAFGNAPSFDEAAPSEVIDRVGRTDWASAVASSVGIDNVQSLPDPDLYVDVSVWIGGDWLPGASDGVDESDGRTLGWWNPRRWFGPS